MGSTSIDDPVSFGRRVRELRQRRGLKQSELAGSELSTAYISRIEAGQRRPERAVVELLAGRLGTTAEFLSTGVGRDEAAEACLAVRYAELALHNGEAADAEKQLRRLLRDVPAAALGSLRTHARVLHARALENLGLLDEAIHGLETLREEQPQQQVFDVHLALCRCYRETGDLTRSIDVGEAGLRLARELGLDGAEGTVRLTVTLAAAYFERGDTAYAAHLCRVALDAAETNSSPAARAAALWNGSVIAAERGRTELAVSLAERAVAQLGETGDETSLARLRLQLGLVLAQDQPPQLAAAQDTLTRAAEQLAASGASAVDLARCEVALALVRLHQGDHEGAAALARGALARVQAPCLVRAQAEAMLGRIAAARGKLAESRRHCTAAVAILTAAGGDREAAALWYELGTMLEAARQFDEARHAYRSAAAAAGVRAAMAVAPVRV